MMRKAAINLFCYFVGLNLVYLGRSFLEKSSVRNEHTCTRISNYGTIYIFVFIQNNFEADKKTESDH